MQDGTAVGHSSTMLALEDGGQSLGSGVLGMLDDAAHFRRICERLAGLDGRSAREAELKARKLPYMYIYTHTCLLPGSGNLPALLSLLSGADPGLAPANVGLCLALRRLPWSL